MEKTKCQRCNHEWLPRVEKILECPKCKSRKWDISLTFGEAFKKAIKEAKSKNGEFKQN